MNTNVRNDLHQRLVAQDWRCASGSCTTPGHQIVPGDYLAVAYDGHGLVHLRCACIGSAPESWPNGK